MHPVLTYNQIALLYYVLEYDYYNRLVDDVIISNGANMLQVVVGLGYQIQLEVYSLSRSCASFSRSSTVTVTNSRSFWVLVENMDKYVSRFIFCMRYQ